ncbi:hypothetical protein Tco_0214402 [Tanacetum coccineum]
MCRNKCIHLKNSKNGAFQAIESLIRLDEHLATFRGADITEIDKRKDKTGQNQARDRKKREKTSPTVCGSANHWSKACRTPSHLCELYQASRKGKEKEVNHVDQFDNTNTELIASDFFNDLEV